jgi:signal peptidase I
MRSILAQHMENNATIQGNPEGSNAWKGLKEWLQVIVIALIISLPIRFFVAEPFIVQGASMDPTFSTGQFLIVDRLSYHLSNPSRGDVIIFEYPNDPNLYYIKRIIGLPNETVDLRDGHVFVSTTTKCPGGIQAEETEIKEPYVDSSHAAHDTSCVELGADEYFVMGDNRAQSSDSRAWGPLSKKFIVGRPIVRVLPISALSIFPGQHRD